jgi:hypothetical protein
MRPSVHDCDAASAHIVRDRPAPTATPRSRSSTTKSRRRRETSSASGSAAASARAARDRNKTRRMPAGLIPSRRRLRARVRTDMRSHIDLEWLVGVHPDLQDLATRLTHPPPTAAAGHTDRQGTASRAARIARPTGWSGQSRTPITSSLHGRRHQAAERRSSRLVLGSQRYGTQTMKPPARGPSAAPPTGLPTPRRSLPPGRRLLGQQQPISSASSCKAPDRRDWPCFRPALTPGLLPRSRIVEC